MNNETLADILAEFRKFALRAAEDDKLISPESVLLLADKAEAAAQMEKVEAVNLTDEKWRRDAGNASAMRAALLRVKEARGRDLEYVTLADIDAEVDAALAEPPRNCDVGTPEEQSARMAKFCRPMCSGCQFNNMEGIECQFAWAQMPYEEGGAE